jgi:hypothetical protein
VSRAVEEINRRMLRALDAIEPAMFLLRESERSVTDVSLDVGFGSLSTFSRTFHDIVGHTPTEYRDRAVVMAVPTCFSMTWTRPSSFGEARANETLKARGVEITSEPTEHFYGTDFGLRDPFGNNIRIVQLATHDNGMPKTLEPPAKAKA